MTRPPEHLTDVFHASRDEAYLRQASEEAAYYDQPRVDRQVSEFGTLTPINGFAIYRKRVQT